MSSSLRFLGWSVSLWVGLRLANFGLIPDEAALAQTATPGPRPLDLAQSAPWAEPAIAAEFFAPPAPGIAMRPPLLATNPSAPWRADQPRRQAVALVPAMALAAAPPLAVPGDAQSSLRLGVRRLDRWPVAALLHGRAPDRAVPGMPGSAMIFPRDERLRLSSWAMMRGPGTGSSLASGGMLGGSQAGARLLYRVRPRLDLSLRMSAPLSPTSAGGEVAAGLRYQPMVSVPIAVTLERRQAFGRGGGRSDFALFAEGGVWERPLGAGFKLDGYAQAGVVGVSRPAAFIDGAATATRPLWRGISGGVGLWGGMQPGASRLDVGPRLTWRPLPDTRIAIDYRLEAAGNARPGSGPVMTLSGDF